MVSCSHEFAAYSVDEETQLVIVDVVHAAVAQQPRLHNEKSERSWDR
jgi:hypothetical protein